MNFFQFQGLTAVGGFALNIDKPNTMNSIEANINT